MLEEGEGDHRQQRVVVEPEPGATLEVVGPEFLLELRVCLLAAPARLDRPQTLETSRAGRMIGQVVLPAPVSRRSQASHVSSPGRCWTHRPPASARQQTLPEADAWSPAPRRAPEGARTQAVDHRVGLYALG